MMSALPNNSYSTTATSMLSNNDNHTEYGILPQTTIENEIETPNNLCLSPSQSIIKKQKNSSSSYLEKAKNKILNVSITSLFTSKKANISDNVNNNNNNKDSLIAAECNDNDLIDDRRSTSRRINRN
eukprot:862868_1